MIFRTTLLIQNRTRLIHFPHLYTHFKHIKAITIMKTESSDPMANSTTKPLLLPIRSLQPRPIALLKPRKTIEQDKQKTAQSRNTENHPAKRIEHPKRKQAHQSTDLLRITRREKQKQNEIEATEDLERRIRKMEEEVALCIETAWLKILESERDTEIEACGKRAREPENESPTKRQKKKESSALARWSSLEIVPYPR